MNCTRQQITTQHNTNAVQTMPVPSGMSLRTAGAIPETWLTAFQLLFLVANGKSGESVVIHAAGSGVGTAAVQLAASRGLFVIAVAGSDKKLEVARALGASALVNYKTSADWAAEVKSHTPGGKGVDIILDPVGGSFWKSNAEIAKNKADKFPSAQTAITGRRSNRRFSFVLLQLGYLTFYSQCPHRLISLYTLSWQKRSESLWYGVISQRAWAIWTHLLGRRIWKWTRS